MSFCKKCGAYVPAEEERCPACGASQREAEPNASQSGSYSSYTNTHAGASAGQYASTAQSGTYQYQSGSEHKTEQSVPFFVQESAEDASLSEKKLNVLSYVGPLFLVPLLLRKDDSFARFHANQGLVLFLFELLTNRLFGGLLGVAAVIFSVSCIVLGARNVAQGKCEPLPLIGGIRLLK